jgi:hypothetical protein
MESLDDRLRGATNELADCNVAAPGLRRRPRVGVAAGAVAVLVIGGFAITGIVRGDGDSTIRLAPETPTTTTASTVATSSTPVPTTVSTTAPPTKAAVTVPGPVSTGDPYWEMLPSPGLTERSFPLVRALGDGVVVVGGIAGRSFGLAADLTDGRLLADADADADAGAGAGAWSPIPNAPVPIGSFDTAEWTGSALLVFTNTGSLLSFDPEARLWAVLAKPPLTARTGAASAWTGQELLVYGGYDPAPQPSEKPVPRSDGAAYSPATGKWRTLPAVPNGSDPLSGQSMMIGSTWLVENGSKGATHFLRYDTATNRWSSDAKSEPDTAFFPVGDSAGLINYNTGESFKFDPVSKAFVATGDRTTMVFGGNNLARIWKSPNGDTVIGDTGPGYTNGRSTVMRESGGAWKQIGSPITTGADVFPVMTSGSRLIVAGAGDAARLRLDIDTTIGVRECVLADFDITVAQPGPSALEFTNHSPTACTVNGSLPTGLEFRVGGSWISGSGPPGLVAAAASGGLIEPGKKAVVSLEGGVYCDSPRKADAIRFSVAGGGFEVNADVTTCWVVGPIEAARPPT